MSYHGLDILWSFAKDDQFDEGELRPDLIDLLFELPISIRDKVEDSGLLAIVEKWSKKRNHSRFVLNHLEPTDRPWTVHHVRNLAKSRKDFYNSF